jgi:hypothetical protein
MSRGLYCILCVHIGQVPESLEQGVCKVRHERLKPPQQPRTADLRRLYASPQGDWAACLLLRLESPDDLSSDFAHPLSLAEST